MRVLSATLLLFGIFTVALSQSCNNPLLAQQEVIDRVGGSANILSTPRTLTANVSVCQFLVGQSVCITDDGFTALAKNLDTYRNAFQERSKKRDEQRFNGVGKQLNGQNQADPRTQNIIQIGNLFNQTVIGFNASGASAPYDFTQFLSKVSAGGWGQYVAPSTDQLNRQNDMIRDNNTKNGQPREQGVKQGGPQQTQQQGQNQQQQQQGSQQGNNNLQAQVQAHHQNDTGQQQGQQNGGKRFLQQQGQQGGQGQGQGNGNGAPPQNNQGWMQVQGNLGQAKAKCGVAVMKQYYFASCLAVTATSNTNGTVGGDASNPTVTVSNDACQGYKSKCTDYFTYATQAENTKSNCDNANSLFAMQIYTTISNSSLSSTEITAQLNVYAVQVLSALNSAAGNQVTKPWSPVSCNSSNTGASDCNYICTKVITATGFSEDNFNLVSTTTTGAAVSGRVLGSGTVILSSTSSGINPDAAISDSNKAVTMSVQSSVDTSSASSLVASVAVVIATVIGLMI